jgi:flagellar assembly factor FliW
MIYDIRVPILGFNDLKKVEFEKIDDIFVKIKNIDNNGIPSFTLMNPYALREYSFDVPAWFKNALEISATSNVLVYNILVVQTPIEQCVVNFLAPLILNNDNKTIGQLVLDANQYPYYGIAQKIADFLS